MKEGRGEWISGQSIKSEHGTKNIDVRNTQNELFHDTNLKYSKFNKLEVFIQLRYSRYVYNIYDFLNGLTWSFIY